MSTSRAQTFDLDLPRYGPLPRTAGLFVTGTDTEVGKTLIAGAIARCLRRAGRRLEVFKPVATGCRQSGRDLVSRDAEFLAACAGSRRPLAEVAPVRYAAPAAPNVAAAHEGRPVDLHAIFEAYGRLADAGDPVIVEGIGGLLCPITDRFWVIHLAKLMALPVVIVARAGLGTINHTLLTVHGARSAGLTIAGVVVNRFGAEADLAMRTNPQQIARRGVVDVLAVVPDDPGNCVGTGSIAPGTESVIARVPWDTWLHAKG